MAETMWAVVAEDDAPLKLADVEKPSCGANDVLVEIVTAGLNRADLVQRRGMYPPPPGVSEIMGLECSGTVVAVGADHGGSRDEHQRGGQADAVRDAAGHGWEVWQSWVSVTGVRTE